MAEVGLKSIEDVKFKEDLKNLLSFSPDHIIKIKDLFALEKGKINFLESQVENLSKSLNISKEILLSCSRISGFILKKTIEDDILPSNIVNELKELAKENSIVFPDILIQSLTDLFTINDEWKKSYRVSIYENAVIDNLTSITCVHELRAIFDKDNKQIVSYLPILIITFRLTSIKDESKHFTFQTDENGLSKLLGFLNNYKDSLNLIKENLKDKINIWNK